MQNNFFTPLTHYAEARSAASGEAQPYLPLRSLRSLGLCARFAPSGFALATYPMTLPGSQEVSMPSFITIGSKLWALEGYKHTYIH